MKLLLCLTLVSAFSIPAFAGKKTEWTPKYQTLNESEITKKSEPVVKRSSKTKRAKASDSERLAKLKAKIKPVAKARKVKANAPAGKKIVPETPLEALYLRKGKGKGFIDTLKRETMTLKQKAVPTLIKVMKSGNYPDENRWIATYMLGKIMGKKAAPFISKFASHPNWMMRLASLKVLLHLNQTKYKGIYVKLLEDKSLIVRHQALQNIKEQKLTELAPFVWKMLYNKSNYVGIKGKRKRANIIKDVIKTVGALEYKKARKPMLKMMSRNKYKDIHEELDYALSKISKKPSPKGSLTAKKHYWKRVALKEVTI